MQVGPEIRDLDIVHTEQVLLPPGKVFDEERRAFIRRLDTLDLHAVPGSGKTTALLAKLLILDRFLPLDDGAGILVLSHTNAAVDEIRGKLSPYCSRLFGYPNFVGTIQSFVDQFLAIPFYAGTYRRQPLRIDNELYWEATSAFSEVFLKGFKSTEQNHAKYFLRRLENWATFRFRREGEQIKLTNGINGAELKFKKPGAKIDWTDLEKQRVEKWLYDFKCGILNRGILCFDDAYFLADLYLTNRPGVSDIVRGRFRYVFVDEMQDMASHQHDLLDALFSEHSSGSGGYQRIGDRNQSIHDSPITDLDCCWAPRDTALAFTNSCRLPPLIAKVVEPFALHRLADFRINGLGKSTAVPTILVFDDHSVSRVIPKFSACIQKAIDNHQLPPLGECVFKVIGWNTVWNDDSAATRTGKRRVVDYWPQFQKHDPATRTERPSLLSYLQSVSEDEISLRPAMEGIMQAISKMLRLEKVVNSNSDSPFTRTTLWNYLRENEPEEYSRWRSSVYLWSIALMNGLRDQVVTEMKDAIPGILAVFEKTLNLATDFVNVTNVAPITEPTRGARAANFVNHHGFDIEIASVHKVKGQTHTATLYLETAFYTDGSGASAKSYESQRLAAQFLGAAMTGSEGKRVKHSAKMVYVGLSRPTHLLYVAVHESHFNRYLGNIESAGWDVIRIGNQVNTTV